MTVHNFIGDGGDDIVSVVCACLVTGQIRVATGHYRPLLVPRTRVSRLCLRCAGPLTPSSQQVSIPHPNQVPNRISKS